MKKLLVGIVALFSLTVFAENSTKGKCSSLENSKYSLRFDLIQTDFNAQIYSFKGSRKALLGKKNFQIDSKFLGIYSNQFYIFDFHASFIKSSANLLIRKEEFRKSGANDDGFIVDAQGYILDSLSCENLNS